MLQLHRGKLSLAVKALERAAEGGASAEILSDLSAAYLALSATDPWLRIDALASAVRAVDLAPRDPAARFNLALAEEGLSLTRGARKGWRCYLDLEPSPAWRAEAAERLKRLDAPTSALRWEAAQTRILALGSKIEPASVDRYAREYPAKIRTLLETRWLPEAASSAAEPRNKKEALSVAKLWSRAIANGGEPLYSEGLAVLEAPENVRSASRHAEGLRLYAEALKAQSDCAQAEPLFESAASRLAEVGSPLAKAAQLGRLVCLYRRRPQDAEERFEALARLPYPSVAAKAEKMAGLCAFAGGRNSQAVAHYRRGVSLLAQGDEVEVSTFQGLLSEAYGVLGDRVGVWTYRLAALREVEKNGDLRLRHSILFGIADELAETGRGLAARPVLDEMIANARTWGEPGAVAETLIRRINLRLAEGNTDLAKEDIAACAQFVEGYRQPADRARVATELKVVAAESNLRDHPEAARRNAQSAVEEFAKMGRGLFLPRALLVQARADLALRDFPAAEVSFRRTLRLYEEWLAATEGEERRILFFATAQKSFDEMIRFEAIDRGDVAAALRYVEQARARGLREHLAAGAGLPPSKEFDLDAILRRFPPRVAAFEYAVLPDILLVWRIYRGSLTLTKLPISREEVARKIADLRRALKNATSGEEVTNAKKLAAEAFDALLAPAMVGVQLETELVFLPDRELHQLPFAALFNSRRGRYLVEDHASWVTPSLGTILSAADLATPVGTLERALIVGEPKLDLRQFPNLPPLPAALREAREIASLYPKKRLVTGAEASRAKILAAIPGSTVVHLAAHVLVEARQPLQSLVATADREGTVLRATDLGARTLAGVRLVFLAACDTALGFSDGDREGVAGLARAILAAGVPAVVATLWPVGDEAIAGLPRRFHFQLLSGDSPAEALRRAQLELFSNRSASRPLAWAPFQLYLVGVDSQGGKK